MSYLFLVNIGPVQEFIASARRTRDLYFGSWLLSDLARTVALQIVEKNEPESLIFPAPTEKGDLKSETFNVANKILALIEQPPQDLAQCIKKRYEKRLHDIRDEAYGDIRLPRADQEIAYKQIDDLIEFQWVALPYDKENHHQEGYYEEKRNQLEALMAARKNTRNFCAVPWKSLYIPKSSIDGKLESVIPEDRYPSRRASYEEKLKITRKLYDQFCAGPAERLSGVDLLKRCGELPERSSSIDSPQPHGAVTSKANVDNRGEFPSTSHIATLPFLKRLASLPEQGSEYVKEKWDDYIRQFENESPEAARTISKDYPLHPILGRHDGGMLFEGQIVDMLHLPTFDTERAAHLQPVKEALRTFHQSVDKHLTTTIRPNPYYALLQADGDSMGKVIDAQDGHDKHREFSKALSSFAKGVDAIVKQHEGALVYAGGDDVLAFLPLHTVLQCADELAKSFREKLKSFAGQEPKPTLSVGIAIVHYLDTLKEARRLAKQAEDRAKAVNGKNALAITISKRSGENYDIAGSWKSIGCYLEKLINFCRADAIPDGTAYELRDLALRLKVSGTQEEKNTHILEKVIKQEVLRILQRKLYVPLGKFPEKQAQQVENFLKAQLGIEQEQQDCEETTTPLAIDEFINTLIVAQTLAAARQLAEPKSKEASNDSVDH